MAAKVDPTCKYSRTHEWVRRDGDNARIGITDYAQQELSDIVYVEVPEKGDTFTKGEVFGVVESVKAATDLYLPVAGEIIASNPELEDRPELVNQDPFGDGWIVEIAIEDPDELDSLMDAAAYEKFVAQQGS